MGGHSKHIETPCALENTFVGFECHKNISETRRDVRQASNRYSETEYTQQRSGYLAFGV